MPDLDITVCHSQGSFTSEVASTHRVALLHLSEWKWFVDTSIAVVFWGTRSDNDNEGSTGRCVGGL